MELKWLQDFSALIEHGSFSKAAEARFVTQPAFSRRIRALEAWLGVALVNRDQYPATLTDAGKAFAGEAELLISQIYAVKSQVADIANDRQQLLIHAQHALAVSFFPSWMHTLEKLTEGAVIRLEAGDLHDSMERFLEGEGDFLLAYGCETIFEQLQRNDIESLAVGTDLLVPVTGIGANGDTLFDPEKSSLLKLLMHPPSSYFGRLIQGEGLLLLPDELEVQVCCENGLSESLKALVLNGFGVAWLPKSLIEHELNEGQLKVIEGPFRSLSLNINLYRRVQTGCTAAIEFWQYLQEQAS